MQQATGRRPVLGWALYDFANSAFTTLIVTFVYATYFTQGIAPNETVGTAQWAWGVTISAIFVAILSPYMGAIADRYGLRRRFLLGSTVLCIAGSVGLFFPLEGQVLLALSIFVVANIAFEMGHVFYNAYLPDIASPAKIGRVSGFGWGLGYVGGLLCLVVALFGFIQTENPLFGFGTTSGEHIRATNLLVAAWYALFAIPIFLWIKSPKPAPVHGLRSVVQHANGELLGTFRVIRSRYGHLLRFLIARLVYNDGLITLFAFGGIYAAGTFGFTTADVIVFGIALNVTSGLGALAFGYLDDHVGGKVTVIISLVGLICFGTLGVLAPTAAWFWVAGLGAGIMVGPNQAASRSLMGRFIPEGKKNEFFGFYAFSGKATSFLGPLLLGQITLMLGSQRAGMGTILIFFVVGLALLTFVSEQKGIAAASASPL